MKDFVTRFEELVTENKRLSDRNSLLEFINNDNKEKIENLQDVINKMHQERDECNEN